MKTYLQPSLFLMSPNLSPTELAQILDIPSLELTQNSEFFEFNINDGGYEHEIIIKDLITWLHAKSKQMLFIKTSAAILSIKHFIPLNHGYSSINIPIELSSLAAQLGLGISFVTQTIMTSEEQAGGTPAIQ